jgi:hypothetical protein
MIWCRGPAGTLAEVRIRAFHRIGSRLVFAPEHIATLCRRWGLREFETEKSEPAFPKPTFTPLCDYQRRERHVVSIIVRKLECLARNPRKRSAIVGSETKVGGSPGRRAAQVMGTVLLTTSSISDKTSSIE